MWSVGSKKSEKGQVRQMQKRRREKSVKHLKLETKRVKEIENQDTKLVQMETKQILNARSYKALFLKTKLPNTLDSVKKLNKTDSKNYRGGSSDQVERNDDSSKKRRKVVTEEYAGRDLKVILDDKSGVGISTTSPKFSHGEKCLEIEDGYSLQNLKSNDSARADCTLTEKRLPSELDIAAEYLKLPALRDSSINLSTTDGLTISSKYNAGKLNEGLSMHIANEGKSDSSRFTEYWVPVQLSNMQLEQYCATLLSNSVYLQSRSKNIASGVLRDVLISIRKCCDHPFILDLSLQVLPTEVSQTADALDFGINASGKLQLLDSMLSDIKTRGSRVLILFQSIGSSGRDSISIGDILDDFLGRRFGLDSYERVESLDPVKSKQAALNKFNDKKLGKFAFLLETRACLPSIKLSSVDTIVIFGSDWNPVNDIRALQKITIDPESKQMKIFRLYSSCTMEEKTLMLEKPDLESINCTSCHKCLMWGASSLFRKLDEFHSCSNALSRGVAMTENSHLEEILTILSQSGINNGVSKSILKVKHNGVKYCTKFALLGEQELQLTDEELPHVFWKKLLEGKRPQWKYRSNKLSSQRNRKRVQYFVELPDKSKLRNEEGIKKCKKRGNNFINPPKLNPIPDEGNLVAMSKEGGSTTPANDMGEPLSPTTFHNRLFEHENGRKWGDALESLYLLLKPEVYKLCETLRLSEDIKGTVEKFFEYVMKNHIVRLESETLSEAFRISLCWTAADWLKKKVDLRQWLVLAKQHLNFCCNKEEVDCEYWKLRCLKHMFLYHTGHLKTPSSPNASNHRQADNVDQSPSLKQLVERDISKSIKKLQKNCKRELRKLTWKQHEEVTELRESYMKEKAELESKHRTELSVIGCLYRSSAGADRIKMLENAFATKVEQHNQVFKALLEDLGKRYISARKEEEHKFSVIEDEVKSWSHDVLLNGLLSNKSRSVLKHLTTTGRGIAQDGTENVVLDELNYDRIAHNLPEAAVPTEISQVVMDEFVESSYQIEEVARPNEKAGWGTVGSSGGFEHHSSDAHAENFVSTNLGNHVSHGTTSSMPHTQVLSEKDETAGVNDDPAIALVGDVLLSESRVCDETMSNLTGKEVSLLLPETSHVGDTSADDQVPEVLLETSSNHVLNDALSIIPTSNMTTSSHCGLGIGVSVNPSTQTLDAVTSSVPDVEVQVVSNGNDSSCHSTEKVLSDNLPPSEEQTPDASMPDEQVGYAVLEPVSRDILEGATINGENSVDSTALDRPCAILAEQQNGEGGDTINHDSSLLELSPVNAPSVQQVGNLAQGGLLPFNQALQDQCFVPSISSEMQDGDAPSNIEGHDMQHVEHPQAHPDNDDAPSDCSNSEVLAIEPAVQTQLSTMVSSSDQNPLGILSDGKIGHPFGTEEQQNGKQLPELQQPRPSNDALLDHSSREASAVEPVMCLSQSDSPSAAEIIEHEPNAEEQNAVLQVEPPVSHPINTEQPDNCYHQAPVIDPVVQPTYSSSGHNDQFLPLDVEMDYQPNNQEQNVTLQFEHHSCTEQHIGSHTALASGPLTDHIPRYQVQTAPVVSRVPFPFYLDPLQNELDRLRKEINYSVKIHEDTKLLMKANCKKEIEEATAQILRKYETELRKTEVQFLSKMKEMDASHNKVLRNKILADALRFTNDGGTSSAAGMRQDWVSSLTPQLIQSQQSGHRSPLVTSMPVPPPMGPQSSFFPATGPRFSAPPEHHGYNSLPFPSHPARSPHIIPISHSASLAPHLQRFRPSTFVPSVSPQALPCGFPDLQTPHYHPVPSSTNIQARPCLMPNQWAPYNLSLNPSLLGQFPPHPTYPSSRAHPAETSGRLPFSSYNLSALELLMDVDEQSGANLPDILSPLPDLGSNPNLSGLGLQGSSNVAMWGDLGGIVNDQLQS